MSGLSQQISEWRKERIAANTSMIEVVGARPISVHGLYRGLTGERAAGSAKRHAAHEEKKRLVRKRRRRDKNAGRK